MVTINKEYTLLTINFDATDGTALTVQEAFPYCAGMTEAKVYGSADNIQVMNAEGGYDIVAGDLHGEPFYQRRKAKDKLCIVIGNEGQGISPAVLAEATLRLKLPMPGKAESLNAAVAGAVMMYDYLRERQTR